MQDKKIHNKDEHTPQTGLKLTEAREGTGGAPAPPQVPPNAAESHEDGSRRVAAPATSPAQNTSSGSSQDQTSHASSPSGRGATDSSDNNDPEKPP
ncbi:mucin-associated surface protein (MASP), putative, partial [Trypanosoma cruzi marinkellei]